MFQVTKPPHIGYIQINPRQDSSKTLQTFTIDTILAVHTQSPQVGLQHYRKRRTNLGDSQVIVKLTVIKTPFY